MCDERQLPFSVTNTVFHSLRRLLMWFPLWKINRHTKNFPSPLPLNVSEVSLPITFILFVHSLALSSHAERKRRVIMLIF